MSPPEAARYPHRGLGLSTNLQASDIPHPYRLLDAVPGLFDFVEYSAPLDLAEARAQATLFEEMWRRRDEVPVLFHPVHLNLYGPELQSAASLAALDAHARAVGSAWVGNDVGWWHRGGRPFPGYLYLAPPMTASGLADCVDHARHVQGHLALPLLLENPAVFRRTGPLHVLDFMASLHARTGCGLLLDLGHLLSFQLVHGLPLEAGLDGFPWEHVRELHLAGGVVTTRAGRATYVDDHTQPVREELFRLLELVRPRCTGLRALTFEGEGHPPEVAARTLERLRPYAPVPATEPEAPGPDIDDPTAGPNGGWSAASPVWALFSAVHGAAAPDEEDGAGLRDEVDFRLAVVAERLDRAFPWTRLGLAASREGLLAFVQSELYRTSFDPEGPSLEAAFGRYARERATRGRDEGLATLVAFESWAQALSGAGRSAAPVPGFLLGIDVVLGTFPADLEEVRFAERRLRRHLLQRAWGSAELNASGFEGLLQAARRAPRRPWQVLLRRRGGRLEIRPLPRASPREDAELEACVASGWLCPIVGD